ncbi:MAG TPA: UrcA family protein [Allosphingosinicella sp.]|nr:UrcA family protein [Allosphingosinicella sp.]
MSKIMFAVALVSAVAIPATAHAQDRSVAVSYADLDLTSAAGVAQLDRRISGAIGRVCGKADHLDLEAITDLRSCRASAQARVSEQRAIALAAARRGGPALALTISR